MEIKCLAILLIIDTPKTLFLFLTSSSALTRRGSTTFLCPLWLVSLGCLVHLKLGLFEAQTYLMFRFRCFIDTLPLEAFGRHFFEFDSSSLLVP